MAVMSSLYEVYFSVFVISYWLYSSHVSLVWSRSYADTSSSTTSLEIFASHAWMLPGLFCDPVMFEGQETTTLLSSWYDRHIKRLFKRTLIIYHKCWLMQKNVHKTGWSLSDAYWCHALVQKLYLLIRDPALSLVCLLSIDYISPCSWRLSVRLFITVLPHLEFISFFFHICFDLSQKAETNSCVPLHESSPSQFSSKSVCLFVICSINI